MKNDNDGTARTAEMPEEPRDLPRYSWYVMCLLSVVYVVHTIDRGVFTVVLQPIKHEFQLSDGHLGFLAGLAYALAFAIAAIPIGLLADRVNRKKLLAALIAIWSLLTCGAGFAGSFAGLLIARAGVGMAEAGGQPVSLSILADYLPPKRRTLGAGVFMSGTGIGSLIGFSLTGVVAAEYGWRMAFFVVGLPGLLLALVVFLTLREPPRGEWAAFEPATPEHSAGFMPTLRYMTTHKGLSFLVTATFISVFANAGIGTWVPTFLIRVHGYDIADAGITMALVGGGAGFLGAVAGGYMSDLVGRRGIHYQPLFGSAVMILSAVSIALAVLLEDGIIMAIALALWSAGFHASHGVSFGLTSGLMPAGMRATAIAVLAVLNNVVGYGFGPQVAGWLSDWLAPDVGRDSLRYAMLVIGLASYLTAAVLFYLSAMRLRTPSR